MRQAYTSAALIAATALTVTAVAGDLRVTEIYAGVSGFDGTEDWFELTNFGNSTISTAGYFYDDESADPTFNDAMPVLDIDPGESVVILVEGGTAAVAEFYSFWGLTSADVKVGAVDDGAGLGAGGDAVFVFDGNTAGANVIVSGSFPGAGVFLNGVYPTNIPFGVPGMNADLSNLSVFNTAGAFASANNAGNNNAPVFGSPGVFVPTPAGAAAGIAMLGLVAGRRRRA